MSVVFPMVYLSYNLHLTDDSCIHADGRIWMDDPLLQLYFLENLLNINRQFVTELMFTFRRPIEFKLK